MLHFLLFWSSVEHIHEGKLYGDETKLDPWKGNHGRVQMGKSKLTDRLRAEGPQKTNSMTSNQLMLMRLGVCFMSCGVSCIQLSRGLGPAVAQFEEQAAAT